MFYMLTHKKNPLRQARRAHDWTQEFLAERASITRQTVIGLEKEQHRPTPATARLLALSLGVPVEELFPDERLSKSQEN